LAELHDVVVVFTKIILKRASYQGGKNALITVVVRVKILIWIGLDWNVCLRIFNLLSKGRKDWA
jgi:hypothetical protein